MPRQRITAGKSIQDIMDMSMREFESYTPAQQREITSRLASAANKRLRNLQKNSIENPATLRLNMSGGKISVKGKSGEDLKNEFFRASQFLNSKFSQTKEWRKFEKKLDASYKNKDEQEHNNAHMGLAFSYFDILQETNPTISQLREKYRLVDVIADFIRDGLDTNKIIQQAKNYLENRYREEQENYNTRNTNFGDRLDNTPKRYKRKRRKK